MIKGYNPRKIGGFDVGKWGSEVAKDPWRAGRAVLTRGGSEILEGAEKTLGTKIGGSVKDVVGENPTIRLEDVYRPVTVSNPYEEQLKAALQQNMMPDFAQAQATAGKQGGFAGQLEQLYGTGAGGLTNLMGQLQRQTTGDFGPGGSLAQQVLQQGLGQNIAGVRAQLASQRGLSPALAARYAAQQTAQLGGQTAQQSALMGLQQQLAAQQQLGALAGTAATLGSRAGDIYGQMRTQDITQATAASDAALKRLSTLAASDTGIRQIQAKTGMDENEIRLKVEAANQAAKMGDRQMAANIIGQLLGGAASIGAAAAGKPAYAGGRISGTDAAPGGYTGMNVGNMPAYAAHGGRVDGMAPLPGDHPKNDIVPAQLSPGEIVVPRSAAGSKKEAKAFIDALDDWDEEPSYGKVLKSRQKKNYAEGGVVEPPDPFATPIPGVAGAKEKFDQMLAERVVEPLAQRGYPTLGAALATVPSTLAEAFVPSSYGDLMGGVIKLPGAKLSRQASKEIKKGNAQELIQRMGADEVDISKLPSSKEYKQFAKEYEDLKKLDLRQGYRYEREIQRKENAADKAFSKIFGSQAQQGSWSPKSWDLEALAYENADNPEVRRALEKVELLDPRIDQSIEKQLLNVKAFDKAKANLYKTLESNKDKLKFSDELEKTRKVRNFPRDFFTGKKPQ